jgi:DNA topoisomerase-1
LANKGRAKGELLDDFTKCDFTPIRAHLDAEKEKKKARSKEEKDVEKAEKKKIQDKYGYAVLDGHKQKVGNYLVEPPGIFLGRGNHPKTGMWKRRLYPEDVILNIGKEAATPPSPVEGHKWKKIEHNDKVTWLAGWEEGLQGAKKYVMLSASSRTKGQSDMAKFDKARLLKKKITGIREAYRAGWKASTEMERQRAVVVYLIDKLALRVGGEKDTDNTADTVGSTSLRVEHLTLREPNILTLDFLGKDSMRYHNTVEIETAVFKNLKAFVKGKKPEDQVFDEVNPTVVNTYLKEFMPGLSAKVTKKKRKKKLV